MTLRAAGRAAAKQAVIDHIGLLPWFEYRLELLRAAGAVRVRRREDAEVARARSLVGCPTAFVVTVIPTYRRPEQLQAAVRSALTQTMSDHRVIVVDDGGGLPELEDDPRLTALRLSTNIGIAGAVRNVGIRASRSAFVAFLDDDNEWRPDHLERSLAAASDADLTYTGIERVDDHGQPIDVIAEPFDRDVLRTRSFVDTSAIVARRDKGVIFSRTPRRFGDFPKEDWEFVWRLSRHRTVAMVPHVTVRYVIHDRSHYTDWGRASAH
jgi:glycosyltransferase involved in cell wall biosynthesis